MKYDINRKYENLKGFYEWNKKRFLLKKDDERFEKNLEFKKDHGFFPDETWSLYSSICIFIVPRLKYFRETTIGCPPDLKSLDEWKEILDKMIWSFENAEHDVSDDFVKQYDDYAKASEAFYTKIHEGLNLFNEYFLSLWW